MGFAGGDQRHAAQALATRRALRLHVAGDLGAAVFAYRAVLKRHPKACDCWCNLGAALRALGRKDDGLEALRRGVRVCPQHVGLNQNLGNALEDAGDQRGAWEHHSQSVDRYQAALRMVPDSAELYNALGWAFFKLRQPEASVSAYARAVALQPASVAYRLDLARVLPVLGRHAENERQLRAGRAQNADVLAALGHALVDRGDLGEGLKCGDAALAIDPEHSGARLARARANFLAGRYAAAWPDYAYRRSFQPLRLPPGVTDRAWEGQGLDGQSIVLYREQGLGDVIQFARYAPLVAQRGAEVVLCCPPVLVDLLRRLPGVASVVPDDEPCPSTTWSCSLMDLPGVLGTDLGSIPADCPYLPPRARSEPLLPRPRQFRVGIVWAGSPTNDRDLTRSCRLDDFAPLVELPGAEFISFQVGPRAQELRASGWRGLIREAGDGLIPFEATADALAEVDLVITVDTVMAHLAGALGRPVWTLLAFAPDWRWMLDRDDTPWYPTMRLFRQSAPNDWAGVFRQVGRELEALLARAGAGQHARPATRRSVAGSSSRVGALNALAAARGT